MMNRILLLMTFLVCFLAVSCDDDSKQTIAAKPVSGLTTVSGPGNVLLKWDKLTLEGVSYIKIAYQSDAGGERKVLVNGHETEKLLYGFGDQKEYTFKVTVCMEDGTESSEQTVRATPGRPAFIDLLSTVSVSMNFGGVDLKWNNQSSEKFYIHVTYVTSEQEEKTVEVDVADQGDGRQFVGITGVLKANLAITVSDMSDNTSEVLIYDYKSLERGKFDRAVWKIADFSSQEETGEKYPNGLAISLIDSDKGTFWHSRWSSDKPNFPHYITIDLQRTVSISRVELTQRSDNKAVGDVELWGSNESGVEGPWTIFSSFNMGSVAGGTHTEKLEEPVAFRYVKVLAKTWGGQGDSYCASFGDFALYGEDIVEN